MKRTIRNFLSLVLSLVLVLSVLTPRLALADDAPQFTAEITAQHKITLRFDRDMIDPFGWGDAGFSYTINGNPRQVNSVNLYVGNPRVYELNLHTGIQPGDTVTLSYTPDSYNPICSEDGDLLEGFDGLSVTNDLELSAPTIFSITTQDDNNSTNNDGTYLSVGFSMRMADPPAAPDGFSVTANGVSIDVTQIYRKPYFDSSYVLRLESPIEYGQTVRLSYAPGTVESYYGVALAADSDHYVNNQVPMPKSADLENIELSGDPENFSFAGNVYTYSNVAVASGVEGITVTPTGAGTITVNGTQVISGAASGAIALTQGVPEVITVVSTEDNKSPKTYTITVLRAQDVATAPSAPLGFTVAAGDTVATLSWSPPSNDGGSAVTGYKVSKDAGQSWVDADSDDTHTFSGLTNGVAYTFMVRAINGAGAGETAEISATPLADDDTPDDDTPDDDIPKMGAGDSYWIWWTLCVTSFIGIVFLIAPRKKKVLKK
ncbi:MAG: fibronectin type III domain-containing protein [Christensenellales bacterium]